MLIGDPVPVQEVAVLDEDVVTGSVELEELLLAVEDEELLLVVEDVVCGVEVVLVVGGVVVVDPARVRAYTPAPRTMITITAIMTITLVFMVAIKTSLESGQ